MTFLIFAKITRSVFELSVNMQFFCSTTHILQVSLYCGTHLHASEAQATLNFKTANGFQVRFFPSPKVCQSSTVGFQHTFRAALERFEGVKLVSTEPLPVAKPRPESFALWQLKRIRDPDFVTKDDQRGPAKKACNVFKTLECVSMYYKNM